MPSPGEYRYTKDVDPLETTEHRGLNVISTLMTAQKILSLLIPLAESLHAEKSFADYAGQVLTTQRCVRGVLLV